MKKIIRLPIILILLIGGGFVYVVKNPSLGISQKILMTLGINMTTNTAQSTGIDLTNCLSYYDGCNTCTVVSGQVAACTKMYCETPAEPQCLEYANTGIDLTNCTSYFDGCNNCTVKDGKPEACTLMYCETPSEPKCNQYASGTENTGTVGLANPASVNCEKNGGTLTIQEGTGGQIGMCTLPDGTQCEERAYMRGECTGRDTPTACTMEYAPVCASVQIQCIKAPCDPIEQTFSNKCVMGTNKLAKFLHDGECGSANR